MPKLVRRKIAFNYDSLLEIMQDCYNQLESMRIKAERDYNKINSFLLGASGVKADFIQLDNAKTNSMKILDSYFKQRMELLRIMKDTVMGRDKIEIMREGNGANNGSNAGAGTNNDEKIQIAKAFQEMMRNKKKE